MLMRFPRFAGNLCGVETALINVIADWPVKSIAFFNTAICRDWSPPSGGRAAARPGKDEMLMEPRFEEYVAP